MVRAGIGERSARGRTRTGMGLPPRDFLTHYSFRCCARPQARTHLGSGLYLCLAAEYRPKRGARRVRQGPSSLYTFPSASTVRTLQGKGIGEKAGGLSSVLQPPRRAAGSPTLTPFTPGVSAAGCSISLKSLASTDFATRARVISAQFYRKPQP